MLTAFYNLGPPEQCLVIGALIAALYCLAFLLLHPLWIRQRIQNCKWRRYQKKILIARIGMIAIIVSTAIAAVYLESRSWKKTAIIAGLIACYILMRCEQSRRKKKH